ncbi:DUF2974 domain-containing protein [Tropicimonas sp. IMCC6043]|uniref:DUF2974 domain-containing protein n=1 Tax=Tropicimonas sp. IMCC6043 TaxID=2510645 RepID=UPI00101B66C3|nr:DUF2974 domain-containing protein [Tropicimonas sp. IMCC6043]RYH09269.1 DUF2974 domain-containing protein [Tropicimonas sp. IMCC6043]
MASIYDYGLLSNAVYETNPSVQGWACRDFHDGLGEGLQAGVFTKGDEIVVAFKGTTPTQVNDVIADLKLGVGMSTSYFSAAEEYVARYASEGTVVATGHSLGGAIAQVVGNRRQIPFVTFNAPGVAIFASRNLHTSTAHMSAVRIAGGLLGALRHPMQTARDVAATFYVVNGNNYRLSGDVVSQIGLHYGDVINISASGDPLSQHSMDTVLERLQHFNYGNIRFP